MHVCIQKVTYQARVNLLTLACHGCLETILHGAILNCLQYKGVADLKVRTATENCLIYWRCRLEIILQSKNIIRNSHAKLEWVLQLSK